MAQENSPYSSEELRRAARTLLVLAAEQELAAGGQLTFMDPRAMPTSTGGDDEGRRRRRSLTVLKRVVPVLCEEADARARDELVERIVTLKAFDVDLLVEAARRAKAGDEVVDASVPAAYQFQARLLPAPPPSVAPTMRPAARDAFLRLVLVVLERNLPFERLGAWHKDLVERLAQALDGEGVQDRFDHHDFPAVVRGLLAAAMPAEERVSATTLRQRAPEIANHADDREKTAKYRRRIVLYALTALECPGNRLAAMDAAEPFYRRRRGFFARRD
jgi:hypothetical protein